MDGSELGRVHHRFDPGRVIVEDQCGCGETRILDCLRSFRTRRTDNFWSAHRTLQATQSASALTANVLMSLGEYQRGHDKQLVIGQVKSTPQQCLHQSWLSSHTQQTFLGSDVGG